MNTTATRRGWAKRQIVAPTDAMARESAFTSRIPLGWTTGVVLRAGRVVIGGSPWEVTVIPSRFRRFARALFEAGRTGLCAASAVERDAARYLLDHGIADVLPVADREVTDVEVVVPVFRHADSLERCLAALALEGLPVVVVDDASPPADARRIRRSVQTHGARLIVHAQNGGPGAARNTGFAETRAPFVAFVDADIVASPDWVARLRPQFDDPVIGAVGPRVRPDIRGSSAIELYEETRSELDMGAEPSRVVYGVPVGWLPSASVIVRREAVSDPPFEPGMRVGEDVDLFWRMEEAGWTVRYVPDVVNRHEVRGSLKDFSARRAMYGGSAADLERRHPRRLIPAQPSLSGLVALLCLSTGKPWLAGVCAAYEIARHRRILDAEVPFGTVVEVAGRTLWSDAFWLGHLLRRDWWPIGVLIALLSVRSRIARGVLVAMAWEPVRDHLLRPARLGPGRSLALRAIDDASYGTGVIRNAARKRVLNVVLPRVRFPAWPRKPQRGY